MENQDARNHSLWATLRVDFQLHRNKPGNEEVAHHRTSPNPFFVKICHVGVFTAHDHLEKDPHRYLMSKFLEKKEAIMITNKPAHEHKFNSDCFARFLVYMLCSFSNPVICTMCLLLHTLFLLFVVCPKLPPIFSVSSSA